MNDPDTADKIANKKSSNYTKYVHMLIPPTMKPSAPSLTRYYNTMLACLGRRNAISEETDSEKGSTDVSVNEVDSAQDASSHVSAVTQAVLYEFYVLQVVFDDTDQMTQTILLLFQVLEMRDEDKVFQWAQHS